MATIRKRGNRYHVQIRRRGQSITRSFDRLATAKSWIPKFEGDIERHLYAESSGLEKITLLELLERYERQILPSHKGQQVEAYSLGILKKRLGSLRLIHLAPVTDGDRTFAEWSADFDSNQEKEVSKILSQNFFQSGLDSLRVGFLNT